MRNALILGIWGNLINFIKPSRVNAVCTAVAGNACKACLRVVYLIMFVFKHGKASLFALIMMRLVGIVI